MLGGAKEAALLFFGVMFQDARGHHRREGEGNDGGDDDGDGEGDSKLAKQTADYVSHEEQRNQNGDQGDGERNDGEADLLGAFQRGLHRRRAFFDVTRNIFDHDDGVVDDESGGNGEGHQGEVVEAVAEGVHGGEGADEGEGHGDAGDDGRGEASKEEEHHHDDEADGEEEFEIDLGDGSLNGRGEVGERGDFDAFGEIAFELREKCLNAVDDPDGVAARLPLDVDNDGGCFVHPGRLIGVFHAVEDFRYIGEHHGRAIAEGDDNVAIVFAGNELIVGVNLVVLPVAVEISFGGIHAGLGDGGAQVFEIDTVGRERGGIGLDADGGFLADAAELGNFGGEARVHQVFHLREWDGT